MNARVAAAQILAPVLRQEASLQSLFDKQINKLDAKDRAFFHTLVFGCLRHYESLSFYLTKLLSKKLKNKDADVQALLLLGLYQLAYLRTPDHAAISETVNAAQKLKKPWSKKLVNAVLRNFQRQQKDLEQQKQGSDPALYNCPAWMLALFQKDWPEQWQKICEAMQSQPPLTLRCNINAQSRDRLAEELQQHGIHTSNCSFSDVGLVCDSPKVFELDAFRQGAFSAQDEAAQLSAELLQLAPGQRVLDACAAPGGKSAHIAEKQSELAKLLALEIDAERAERISENFERLKLHNKLELKVCDASALQQWWDGAAFDRILLDAPCSASGIIRRHPDIKCLRRSDDLQQLSQLQALLLGKLWQCLKPGGILVYATCSIFKRENEEQISGFLAEQQDAQELVIDANWGEKRDYGRQLFPQSGSHDGFYYACLQKSQ
ncbi:16S rRNA (cytosine(967)-C(5))-methyltransferase RsmB [Agaribacterium haliotis]|uniref:16S rRNA (cytosine(967)-C(5))-methyltransferase RsmB n=1 Tax=Agaribacterium haliotis TaxID=2013869 RepID=UPI000BB57755|nr:16S rRNA (cytosine(967)-C(5))-methyltransferase RsmB [Agaribacterium haliotis]